MGRKNAKKYRKDKQEQKHGQPRLLVVNDSRDPNADDSTFLATLAGLGMPADLVLNSDFLPSVDTVHYTSRLEDLSGRKALDVLADLIDEFCKKMTFFKEPETLPLHGEASGAKGYSLPLFAVATDIPSRARMGAAHVWVSEDGMGCCVVHLFDNDGQPQNVDVLPEDALYMVYNAMPAALRAAAREDKKSRRYYDARFGNRKSA